MEGLTYQESAEFHKEIGRTEWGSTVYGEALVLQNVRFASSYEEIYPWMTTIDHLTVFFPNQSVLEALDESYVGAQVINEKYEIFFVVEIEEVFDEAGELARVELKLRGVENE